MSGTNYTRTPNLQLYKPTYKADGEMWGDHINYNTDVLDGAVVANGGTVTGPLIVTATNGTTPRSVQDRFGDVVDIHDFGQIGTGNAATDTATFQAAVAALPANGGLLWIGGTNTQGITLNQTITITKSCKILGGTSNGWCSTIVCLMSGPAIQFSDPTPSYQKTFEVENVRFVANGSAATEAAIQVSIGPAGPSVFPSFVGRNLTFTNNAASSAGPAYSQTFTNGIEFAPASVGPDPQHNFWNVVLQDVTFTGSNDSATSQPIAGTAGIKFGQLVYASFRNVCVSSAASGFRQTAYAEGITCLSCQLFNVANGWDQSPFAPIGTGLVKLNQGVLIGSMIQANQSALNLDCVWFSTFQGNYLTGAGAANVLLSNAQSSQVVNNNLNSGTIGISLTKGSYNEGFNLVAQNIIANAPTHVSLGTGTHGDMVLDNSTSSGGASLVVSDSGTASVIRNPAGPLMTLGTATSTDSELKLLGATNAWRALSIYTGSTAAAGQRWTVGVPSTSEDFTLTRYDTSGTNQGTPFVISQANGAMQLWNGLGLFGHAPVTARPTVTGAKGGNAALASLLTTLAGYGLLTDSTT